MTQSEFVKRIEEICIEHDARVEKVGWAIARLELAKALAECENAQLNSARRAGAKAVLEEAAEEFKASSGDGMVGRDFDIVLWLRSIANDDPRLTALFAKEGPER